MYSYVVGASGAICALIVAVGMNQSQQVIGLNLFVKVVWVKMKATRGCGRGPIGTEKQRDMDYNADRRSHEEQIDAILDKISKHGYDGLTAEEKQMLFDASKRKKKE